MLYRGIAVIIRNRDELEVFARAANKKGYCFETTSLLGINMFPVRISCNADRSNLKCLSKSHDLDWPLNPTITEVVEASELFRNQLISIRRAKS